MSLFTIHFEYYFSHRIRSSDLLFQDFDRENAVVTSISAATAVLETESAPKMAYFSSKGPNHVAPGIIKVRFPSTLSHFYSYYFFCVGLLIDKIFFSIAA